MEIKFECADKINGKVTVVVAKADYEEKVKKTLKDYRKKANIPGFRPGNAPMALIEKQYGAAVKVDEINHLLSEKVDAYIRENKIQILGSPLMNEEENNSVDFEKAEEFTFVFDVAIAPEFKISLTKKNKVPFYTIKVDDELINQQIEVYTSRTGQYVKVKTYKDGDMLKGDIRELEGGETKEGGVTIESAVMMPKYMKDKEQQDLFKDCKPGDVITFNPYKAYEGNQTELASFLKITREQAAEMKSDFTYQVTEVTRYEKGKVDQDLFDNVYGKDAIKTEEDFRKQVAEDLTKQMVADSDYRFIVDLRAYCEKKVGKLEYPDALMKRMMKRNNPDKDDKYIEDNYDNSMKELTWHLIREKLVEDHEIKIENADIKAAAIEATRAQFAQYGMNNVPDEYLMKYAEDMLKKEEMVNNLVDRSIDRKLTDVMKTVVTLDTKEVTLKEFNALFEK